VAKAENENESIGWHLGVKKAAKAAIS